MEIYAVVNQKGGVGKTTTSVNFAIGLARAGKRVLAVDLDPQGSLSIALGIEHPDQLTHSVCNHLKQVIQELECDPKEGILSHPEGIDFLPANIELAGLEVALVSEVSREQILSLYLDSLALSQPSYDVVVIDCSPNLGLITYNALTCADHVVIPVQAQYLSLKGMEQLFYTIGKVKRKLNRGLDISGILVTMANLRTNYNKEIVSLLHENYGEKLHIFQEVIPYSVRASESSALGQSMFTYDPQGKVAEAYESFVQEILNHTET